VGKVGCQNGIQWIAHFRRFGFLLVNRCELTFSDNWHGLCISSPGNAGSVESAPIPVQKVRARNQLKISKPVENQPSPD
jgi:hypothetical protein